MRGPALDDARAAQYIQELTDEYREQLRATYWDTRSKHRDIAGIIYNFPRELVPEQLQAFTDRPDSCGFIAFFPLKEAGMMIQALCPDAPQLRKRLQSKLPEGVVLLFIFTPIGSFSTLYVPPPETIS